MRTQMISSARRVSARPVEVKVEPYPYRHRSFLTRVGLWFTPERGDYIIGCLGVIGAVIAFGWTVINWLVLRGGV